MQGMMAPMGDPRRRRGVDGMPPLDAMTAPEPTMVAPLAATPEVMAPPAMSPEGVSPEQLEELRRWFAENKPGAAYR